MFNTPNFFSDKTNWDKITQELKEINWKETLKDINADDILDLFYSTVFETCS